MAHLKRSAKKTMNRIPCTKCGRPILEVTAKVNDGHCGPCARGAGLCVVCGKRVWERNPSGEYIHMNCVRPRKEAAAVASSGITWKTPGDINWSIVELGILVATRDAFKRLSDAHPNREVRGVTLAYRIEEGVRIEPCVTFIDGTHLNSSLDDSALGAALEPFDFAFARIENSLNGDPLKIFIELSSSKSSAMMQFIFNTLEREGFGLRLAHGCIKTLKKF